MYLLRPPAAPLAAAIENYWAVLPSDGPVDLRVDVYVDARADLVFNFGAPYRREVIGGASAEIAASNYDAQRLVPIRIVQRGDVRVFGVRFRLGGVAPFARAALAAFTGQTPPPEAVFGAGVGAVARALAAAPDLDAAAAVLDAFFLDATTGDAGRETVAAALAALVARDGGIGVTDLGAAVGASPRQLERLFRAHVGLPPKAVARVLRFQHALRALMRDPGCTLAEVALAAGYYDQAHLVRDFRAMTGGVPRGYRGYYPPQAPTDFAPNVVVFVQDGRGGGA